MNMGEWRELALAYLQWDALLLVPALLAAWLYNRSVLGKLVPRPAAATKHWLLQAAAGAALALLALALSILPAWLGQGFAYGPGYAVFDYIRPAADTPDSWLWVMLLWQTLFEELAYRGIGVLLLGALLFWLSNLVLTPAAYRAHPLSVAARRFSYGSWMACGLLSALVTSLGFAWAHRLNPAVTPLALINITLAGLVLSLIYWQQGTPWGAWLLHFVWNAGLAVLGLPVSGLALSPPVTALGATGARAGWLSGGAFGPEASLPGSLALLLVTAYLLWRGLRGLPPRQHASTSDPADPPPPERAAQPEHL